MYTQSERGIALFLWCFERFAM